MFPSSTVKAHAKAAPFMRAYRGRLVPGHCLIVPSEHVASARQVDEHVWMEMRNFKKCLLQMFAAQVTFCHLCGARAFSCGCDDCDVTQHHSVELTMARKTAWLIDHRHTFSASPVSGSAALLRMSTDSRRPLSRQSMMACCPTAQGKEMVFMETAMGLQDPKRHAFVECIPVPPRVRPTALQLDYGMTLQSLEGLRIRGLTVHVGSKDPVGTVVGGSGCLQCCPAQHRESTRCASNC